MCVCLCVLVSTRADVCDCVFVRCCQLAVCYVFVGMMVDFYSSMLVYSSLCCVLCVVANSCVACLSV